MGDATVAKFRLTDEACGKAKWLGFANTEGTPVVIVKGVLLIMTSFFMFWSLLVSLFR